ncbi:hypothetical protein SPHINGOR109_50030 [Sphingorhabdus sp. 109]|nr:hypothetical protein SPHINGOR109_50030 [Sphingorhabdus sp. 109]
MVAANGEFWLTGDRCSKAAQWIQLKIVNWGFGSASCRAGRIVGTARALAAISQQHNVHVTGDTRHKGKSRLWRISGRKMPCAGPVENEPARRILLPERRLSALRRCVMGAGPRMGYVNHCKYTFNLLVKLL